MEVRRSSVSSTQPRWGRRSSIDKWLAAPEAVATGVAGTGGANMKQRDGAAVVHRRGSLPMAVKVVDGEILNTSRRRSVAADGDDARFAARQMNPVRLSLELESRNRQKESSQTLASSSEDDMQQDESKHLLASSSRKAPRGMARAGDLSEDSQTHLSKTRDGVAIAQAAHEQDAFIQTADAILVTPSPDKAPAEPGHVHSPQQPGPRQLGTDQTSSRSEPAVAESSVASDKYVAQPDHPADPSDQIPAMTAVHSIEQAGSSHDDGPALPAAGTEAPKPADARALDSADPPVSRALNITEANSAPVQSTGSTQASAGSTQASAGSTQASAGSTQASAGSTQASAGSTQANSATVMAKHGGHGEDSSGGEEEAAIDSHMAIGTAFSSKTRPGSQSNPSGNRVSTRSNVPNISKTASARNYVPYSPGNEALVDVLRAKPSALDQKPFVWTRRKPGERSAEQSDASTIPRDWLAEAAMFVGNICQEAEAEAAAETQAARDARRTATVPDLAPGDLLEKSSASGPVEQAGADSTTEVAGQATLNGRGHRRRSSVVETAAMVAAAATADLGSPAAETMVVMQRAARASTPWLEGNGFAVRGLKGNVARRLSSAFKKDAYGEDGDSDEEWLLPRRGGGLQGGPKGRGILSSIRRDDDRGAPMLQRAVAAAIERGGGQTEKDEGSVPRSGGASPVRAPRHSFFTGHGGHNGGGLPAAKGAGRHLLSPAAVRALRKQALARAGATGAALRRKAGRRGSGLGGDLSASFLVSLKGGTEATDLLSSLEGKVVDMDANDDGWGEGQGEHSESSADSVESDEDDKRVGRRSSLPTAGTLMLQTLGISESKARKMATEKRPVVSSKGQQRRGEEEKPGHNTSKVTTGKSQLSPPLSGHSSGASSDQGHQTKGQSQPGLGTRAGNRPTHRSISGSGSAESEGIVARAPSPISPSAGGWEVDRSSVDPDGQATRASVISVPHLSPRSDKTEGVVAAEARARTASKSSDQSNLQPEKPSTISPQAAPARATPALVGSLTAISSVFSDGSVEEGSKSRSAGDYGGLRVSPTKQASEAAGSRDSGSSSPGTQQQSSQDVRKQTQGKGVHGFQSDQSSEVAEGKNSDEKSGTKADAAPRQARRRSSVQAGWLRDGTTDAEIVAAAERRAREQVTRVLAKHGREGARRASMDAATLVEQDAIDAADLEKRLEARKVRKAKEGKSKREESAGAQMRSPFGQGARSIASLADAQSIAQASRDSAKLQADSASQYPIATATRASTPTTARSHPGSRRSGSRQSSRSRSRGGSRKGRRGRGSPRRGRPVKVARPPQSEEASARARRLWNRLRSYILDAQPAVQHLVALLEARRIAREAVAEGRVTLEVEEEDDEPSILKQGDLVFYTSASLAARRRLGNHPAVLEAIRSHWLALVGYKPEGSRFLEQDEYLRYFLMLHRRLVPEVPEDEARTVIAAEWVKDSKGQDRMDYASFHGALFEVLDTFTASIDLEEYLDLSDEHKEATEELGKQLEQEYEERAKTPEPLPPPSPEPQPEPAPAPVPVEAPKPRPKPADVEPTKKVRKQKKPVTESRNPFSDSPRPKRKPREAKKVVRRILRAKTKRPNSADRGLQVRTNDDPLWEERFRLEAPRIWSPYFHVPSLREQLRCMQLAFKFDPNRTPGTGAPGTKASDGRKGVSITMPSLDGDIFDGIEAGGASFVPGPVAMPRARTAGAGALRGSRRVPSTWRKGRQSSGSKSGFGMARSLASLGSTRSRRGFAMHDDLVKHSRRLEQELDLALDSIIHAQQKQARTGLEDTGDGQSSPRAKEVDALAGLGPGHRAAPLLSETLFGLASRSRASKVPHRLLQRSQSPLLEQLRGGSVDQLHGGLPVPDPLRDTAAGEGARFGWASEGSATEQEAGRTLSQDEARSAIPSSSGLVAKAPSTSSGDKGHRQTIGAESGQVSAQPALLHPTVVYMGAIPAFLWLPHEVVDWHEGRMEDTLGETRPPTDGTGAEDRKPGQTTAVRQRPGTSPFSDRVHRMALRRLEREQQRLAASSSAAGSRQGKSARRRRPAWATAEQGAAAQSAQSLGFEGKEEAATEPQRGPGNRSAQAMYGRRKKRRASLVGARRGSVSLSVLSEASSEGGQVEGRVWAGKRRTVSASLASRHSASAADVVDRLSRHASRRDLQSTGGPMGAAKWSAPGSPARATGQEIVYSAKVKAARSPLPEDAVAAPRHRPVRDVHAVLLPKASLRAAKPPKSPIARGHAGLLDAGTVKTGMPGTGRSRGLASAGGRRSGGLRQSLRSRTQSHAASSRGGAGPLQTSGELVFVRLEETFSAEAGGRASSTAGPGLL